jgi:hypothetical protein
MQITNTAVQTCPLFIQLLRSLHADNNMSKRPRTARGPVPTLWVEFIPGRIDSPEDFPRPSVVLDLKVAAQSAYLRTKIRPQEHSGPIPCIELTSTDPRAFKIYARWLSTGFVAVPTRHAETPFGSLSWRDCEVLVKAHILGSQYGDEKFQDRVMDALVLWLDPKQGFDSHIFELVFGRQASGVSQMLKCLVVDRMFADEMKGEELLALFAKRVLDGKVGNHDAEGCEYHVHGNERGGDEHDSAARTSRPKTAPSTTNANYILGTTTIVEDMPPSTSRTKSRRIPVVEPWSFSARSLIPRTFEDISIEPISPHRNTDLFSLPPPFKLHPSLRRGYTGASPDKVDGNTDEVSRRNRPTSQRQDSFYLPPPPKLHLSLLQDVSPNNRLLADITGARRRATTATPTTTRREHEGEWPLRSPTPFEAMSTPPNEPRSRPSTRQTQRSTTPRDIPELTEGRPEDLFY